MRFDAAQCMSTEQSAFSTSHVSYEPCVVQHARFYTRGLSLIDTVVGISIITIVFFGLFGAFKLSIELVFSTKAKTSAVALLSERMEYIRSLSYDDVGTVGGIPAGPLEQETVTTLNGIPYTVRTLVQFTDAPEDGVGDEDENGIVADYKTVKVEVRWLVRESPRSTFAVTRLAPTGLETLAGGGTLRISVFDAVALPVPQASVRVINSVVVPPIDVTALSNESGVVSFPGAPQSTGYEVYVSKTGFSTAQTYGVSTENPNPSPIHVSVADGDTTSVSFAIDRVGALALTSQEPPDVASFSDSFLDQSGLAATSSVAVVGGAVVLEESSGVYTVAGTALSSSISPSNLLSWGAVTFTSDTPPQTDALIGVYYFDGSTFVLVPDSDLPGNSSGLSPGASLSALSTTTYPTLRVGAALTSDGSATPSVFEWSISYTAGPNVLPDVEFSIFGNKTIGTTALGAPIYKFNDTVTTNQYGEWTLSDLEWDVYSLNPTGTFDIVELCPRTLTVEPGETQSATVTLDANTAHSLRVAVESGGVVVPGAQVQVERTGFSEVGETSPCGQFYRGGISSNTYTVTVTHPTHQTHQEDVAVSGDTLLIIPLIPN